MQRSIGVTAQDATLDELLTGRQNLVMVGRLSGLRPRPRRGRGPPSCSSSSTSPTPPTGPEASTRAACAGGSTWPPACHPPAGALPRRADHRARPDQPGAHVGRDPRARRRRRDAAADHPVPRRGRRARRPDRGHRPRPGDRRRHGRRAQGTGRRRAPRGHPQRAPIPPRPARSPPFVAGAVHVEPRRPAPARARPRARPAWPPPSCARSTQAGITVDDVEVHQPSLDDVFFALTGHPSEADDDPAASPRRPASSWGSPANDQPRRIDPSRDPLGQRARSRGRLNDVAVLTGRNLVHIAREPLQLSDVTIQPVLFTLLFVYVFGAGIALPHGGSYADFADRRPARAQPHHLVDGHRGRAQHRPEHRASSTASAPCRCGGRRCSSGARSPTC